jgi:hypothetical protein
MVTQTSDAMISIGWPPRSFSILIWREIDYFIDFLQNKSQSVFPRLYHKRKQLWNNFCIKIICLSHHTHYHFNTTSDKIHMTNKTWLSNIPLIHSNTHEYAMVLSQGDSENSGCSCYDVTPTDGAEPTPDAFQQTIIFSTIKAVINYCLKHN